MSTVRAQEHPLAALDARGRTQITRHVARRLDDPEAPIAKDVHGLVERAERHPGPLELRPAFFRDLWVEHPRVVFMRYRGVGVVWFQL